MAVPLFDTATPLAPLRQTILERIAEVVADGRFVLGPNVQAFEQEFADYLGVRHAIGVANGTDAITIALRALGVKPGDDVVVPASPSTRAPRRSSTRAPGRCSATSIRHAQRHRRYGPRGPDPADDRRRLGRPVRPPRPGPRASLACPCSRTLRRLPAPGAGAPWPARWVTSATFSFYPSKNLGAFGDGGAIVTDDDDIADAGAVAALSRVARQGDIRSRWLQLAPGRDPGRDSAGAAAPPRHLV